MEARLRVATKHRWDETCLTLLPHCWCCRQACVSVSHTSKHTCRLSVFLYSNIYFKCGNNYTANLLGCTTGIDNVSVPYPVSVGSLWASSDTRTLLITLYLINKLFTTTLVHQCLHRFRLGHCFGVNVLILA